MKNYSYFSIIRKTTLQILDIFNDIQVKRYDKNGNVIKVIGNVPLRFGPKSKIWNWIEQKNFDVVLPAISVYFSGIEYDTERVAGIQGRVLGNPNYTSGIYSKIDKPVPYDLLYKVTIWTKYYEDLNQILENVLPYFQPFVYITIKEPVTKDLLNFRVDLEGISSGSNEDYSVEDRRVISWDLSIRVKALLFKFIDTDAGKLIKTIYVHWWGRDATAVYSNIDGTEYTVLSSPKIGSAEDIAMSVTRGIDYDGGILDWEYSIYEPGDKYQ